VAWSFRKYVSGQDGIVIRIFLPEAVLHIIDAGFLKLKSAKNIPHKNNSTVGRQKPNRRTGVGDGVQKENQDQRRAGPGLVRSGVNNMTVIFSG
jgi:hypothetical protein